jgi:hypothetical protein
VQQAGNVSIPKDLTIDQAWITRITRDYESDVRIKQAEQVKLRKQGTMKDSLRLSLTEMGNTHYKSGYLDEAVMSW